MKVSYLRILLKASLIVSSSTTPKSIISYFYSKTCHCGLGGDVFKVVEQIEDITNFNDQLKRVCEITGGIILQRQTIMVKRSSMEEFIQPLPIWQDNKLCLKSEPMTLMYTFITKLSI